MKYIVFLLCCCFTSWVFAQEDPSILRSKNAPISKVELKTWWQKDYATDTIPGISLDKAYKELLANKIGDTIIVAVLDSGFDIQHEDLKKHIWVNADEILDNNFDDDTNGYDDDIHGWNFLGNANGDILLYANWEFVRILKKHQSYFKNKDTTNLEGKDVALFAEFKRAKQAYKHRQKELAEDKKYIKKFVDDQQEAKEALKKYFPDNSYTVDDIYKIDPKGDEELKQHLINRIQALYYHMDDRWIEDFKRGIELRENYKLNRAYNPRNIIGDHPGNIEDQNYGNNHFSGDLRFESHGTGVSGIIAANRNNAIGIRGIADRVKIMPIRVVPRGDEYDKDVALAIKYAVDNGAKVINMSFGKQFSMYPEFVWDAIKYAAKRQVLIVSAAGNESLDIDKNAYYPTDVEKPSDAEISDNFLKIGATTHHLEGSIYADFSNYGKMNVDLFAPGDDLYTTLPDNTYQLEGGTSFATPVVAGTAALIWSYYSNLSVSEVKRILMQSGTSYTIDIEIEQNDGTKKMVPFSELSKSGKIVNAYNALLMAEELSKK